jgi:hypothetical protein
MRNRYGRALLGAAAVPATAALGLTAAGAASASTQSVKPAITPACAFNDYCSDPLFNIEFGLPYFVNNANANDAVGNPVNMAYANDNNPGQDWHITFQYPVFVLYHLGFISAGMELHYHFRPAFEDMWTPYGVSSNLCRGLARTAYAGERVTLQPCGNFPKTLWVVKNDYYSTTDYGGFALINGSTTNPSVPYVLTAGGSLWGGNPFSTLQVDQLVSDDGYPNQGQLWCTATESFDDVTPSTGTYVGPPTYTANSPDCFPDIDIDG